MQGSLINLPNAMALFTAILALRFLMLQSPPGISIRFLLLDRFNMFLDSFEHARHQERCPVFFRESLLKSDKGLIILHLKQLIVPDDPSATAFISAIRAFFSGDRLPSLYRLFLSLAFSLFLEPLLYSRTQDRHQLANPDLLFLLGENSLTGNNTLHFEHDLFMWRIVPSL